MYSEGQSKARIGRVSIDIKANRYRIRFSYPKGKRHQLRIAQVTNEGWITALKTAQLIDRDISLGDFDETYARYSPTHAKALELAQGKKTKTYTLIEIWQRYKDLNKNRIAQTTQNYLWKDCDRYLSRVAKHLLELNNAQKFVSYLQNEYATSTIATLFRSCINPAINSAVKAGLIEKNPYNQIQLEKQIKKPILCYEIKEIKCIIAAFANDTYNPKSSRYKHSHYTSYVEFLALTGTRPEEALALTFEDIKRKGNKTYIRINKAYSKGVLLAHTKTREIRLFPVNDQLTGLLNRIPKTSNLLFPGVTGGYINHHRFRESNWRKVINGLVSDGSISQYLKPYSLRHSFITRLIRDGVDIATVARISGNSTETIINHYLAARESFNVPEL